MLSFLTRPVARRAMLASWALFGALLAGNDAHAVPAYARQTGSACADCHAGAYGPALTPYGMRFKLNGYTDTDGQGTKFPWPRRSPARTPCPRAATTPRS